MTMILIALEVVQQLVAMVNHILEPQIRARHHHNWHVNLPLVGQIRHRQRSRYIELSMPYHHSCYV